jgi:uncharacterized protein YegJ (DUF2314 family)
VAYRHALLACLLLAPLACADDPKKPDPKKADDKPLRSLVFLRTTGLELTDANVTAAFQKAFPKLKVGTDDTDDVVVVVTKVSAFCTLKKGKLTLLVNSFPSPYVKDRDDLGERVLKLTEDKAMAAAAKEHEAWLSVDILGDDITEKNEEAHYEVLSKVAAAFHDKSSTVLFYPEHNRMRSANAAAVKSLKAGKGLELAKDGVIGIDGGDADLKAAVETARKSWKDFEKAFAAGTGENHSVKFKFTDKKNGSEFMWVKVEKIDGDTVVGKLANVPNFLTNIKEGDVVKRPAAEIEDWLYVDGKKMVGGFSIEVLQKRQQKRTEDKK